MKKIITILIFIFIISTTAGCRSDIDEPILEEEIDEEVIEIPEEPKKIVIAGRSDWQGTDHFQINEINSLQKLIGDSLIVLNENKEMVPNIAASFEIADDGSYFKIVLPEGLTFCNGTPVTPEDVKASVLYGLKNSPYRWDYMNIYEININGNEIEFLTESFSSTCLYNFCSTYVPIAQKSQIESLTRDEMLTQSDQYGLFYIDEFVAGSHYTLLRNDGYKTNIPEVENKGPSYIDEIKIKIIPDGLSRVNALKNGEVDIAMLVPGNYITEIKENTDIEVIEYATPGIRFLSLNLNNPILSDIKVREAIALAINREEIEEANKGIVKTAYSFVVPEMLDYSQEVYDYYKNTYSNNVDKAKIILDEAGWVDSDDDGYLDKNGQIFEITVNASVSDTDDTTQVLQTQMKKIGIKVNIEMLDYVNLREKVENGEYDVAFVGFTWIDPPSILPYMIKDTSSVIDSSFFDLSFEAAFIQDDVERQKQLFEAQKLLMDELCKIPVLQTIDYIAYNKRVTGLKVLSDTDILFNDVDIVE